MSYQVIKDSFYTGSNDIDDDSRDTLKRFRSIIDFLTSEGYKIDNMNCIDYGCNNGVITNGLALRGMNCIGIENNTTFNVGYTDKKPLDIARENRTNHKIYNALFYGYDMNDYVIHDNNKYDYSIVFSILHNLIMSHFQNNKPLSIDEVKKLFHKILNNTNHVIFYENDDNYKELEIYNLMKDIEGFTIYKLTNTRSYNGDRYVYAIVKHNPERKLNYHKLILDVIHNTGTAKEYVLQNEEYLKNKFKFNSIYPGSLNLSIEKPITVNYDIKDIKVNFMEDNFRFFKCYINGILCYATHTTDNMIEAWSDREIIIKDGKVLFEVN